jgi:hypothetical protein
MLPGTPSDPAVVRECFLGADNSTVQATIERVLESVDDVSLIHVRLTFNPNFVDNSYGTTSIGWGGSKNGTHAFKELVGSDHSELLFTNGQGEVALHVKLDYISQDASRPSGYGALGVLGGEGSVLVGNAAHVRQVATSLDRNLNGCGYGSYVESSPATDDAYTPNPATPSWDYRVVYELWIDAAAFGASGFGGASIEYVHASPSKTGSNTLIVDSAPCPPDDMPPCPPGTVPRTPGGDPTSGPGDTGTTGGTSTGGTSTGGTGTDGTGTGGTGTGGTGTAGTGNPPTPESPEPDEPESSDPPELL